MYSIGWGIGTAVAGGLAYLTVGPFGWRGYLVASALIGLPFLIVLFLIRESPRYDTQAGKIQEAQKTVKVLAKLNCTSKQFDECEIDENPTVMMGQEMNTFYQSYQALKETGYVLEFWILLCIQFTGTMAYTSMLYACPRFMNEGYCSTAVFVEKMSCTFDDSVLFYLGVVGLADPIGIILGVLIVNYLGRIRSTLASAIFPLLSLALLYVCAGSRYALAVLIIIKGSVAILPFAIGLIATESFPTQIRAFTVSATVSVGCLASVLSAYIVAYAYEANPLFAIIMMQGMLFITSAGACFIKRETTGTQLE
jgi:putative MFS transporter